MMLFNISCYTLEYFRVRSQADVRYACPRLSFACSSLQGFLDATATCSANTSCSTPATYLAPSTSALLGRALHHSRFCRAYLLSCMPSDSQVTCLSVVRDRYTLHITCQEHVLQVQKPHRWPHSSGEWRPLHHRGRHHRRVDPAESRALYIHHLCLHCRATTRPVGAHRHQNRFLCHLLYPLLLQHSSTLSARCTAVSLMCTRRGGGAGTLMYATRMPKVFAPASARFLTSSNHACVLICNGCDVSNCLTTQAFAHAHTHPISRTHIHI